MTTRRAIAIVLVSLGLLMVGSVLWAFATDRMVSASRRSRVELHLRTNTAAFLVQAAIRTAIGGLVAVGGVSLYQMKDDEQRRGGKPAAG